MTKDFFGTIGAWFKEWSENRAELDRVEKIKKECGNVCFCPSCGDPLNDGEVRVVDEDGLYEYTCGKCGEKPIFAFHIAPCPIYLKDYIESKAKNK